MHSLQKAIHWSQYEALKLQIECHPINTSDQFLAPAAVNLSAEDKQLAECGGPKHKHPPAAIDERLKSLESCIPIHLP
jgi:hypothetical protein